MLKKLSYLLAVGMTAVSLSGAVFAADDMSPDAIAERIKPVGQVYTAKDLEGIAGAGAAPAAAAIPSRSLAIDRKSTRLNSSHSDRSRMPSSA